ncbi:MAG: isochorismatase family protein [Alphaproteobacteria bacterium]|nr:isochorismatase family protein [Alphaproteobacteria bacterium]
MRFVVVVDTQWDFMDAEGDLAVAGAEALIPAAEAFLRGLRPEETAGVLFTFDTHVPEVYAGSAEAEQFPPHCVKGSDGWANVLATDLVDPAIPVHRLEKGVFDMWAEPGLTVEDARGSGPSYDRDAFFAALRQRVDAVTVIGVAADYCVKWAVDGLLARGFRVTVPADLTRGIARQIREVAAEDFGGRVVVGDSHRSAGAGG